MTARRHSFWNAAALCSALVVLGSAAHAQQPERPLKAPTPRLAPVPSGNAAIPAGTDTGSPVSSDSKALGLPVLTNDPVEREAIRSQSAAARAAARGPGAAVAASGVGCTPRVAGGAASGVAARTEPSPARPRTSGATARSAAPVVPAPTATTTATSVLPDCP